MQERNWNWKNNRLFCHIFCHWWSFIWGGGSPGPSPPPSWLRYAPIKENKKGIRKFSARFLVVSKKILTVQKIVLSSSRGQGNFRGLEASRPRTRPSRLRPRASKRASKGLHLWYPAYACYASHKLQLLASVCKSTLSRSLRNMVDCKTLPFRLEKGKSCGLAVADFKNYEVVDLRLRIQESWNVIANLLLRTKLLNVQMRTCGWRLRKLKFGCGLRTWKKLAVPCTANNTLSLAFDLAIGLYSLKILSVPVTLRWQKILYFWPRPQLSLPPICS